jgi:hypothetical protein
LQQDTARDVFLALPVDDFERYLLQHHLAHFVQGDVPTFPGIIETSVRILLDQAFSGLVVALLEPLAH